MGFSYRQTCFHENKDPFFGACIILVFPSDKYAYFFKPEVVLESLILCFLSQFIRGYDFKLNTC